MDAPLRTFEVEPPSQTAVLLLGATAALPVLALLVALALLAHASRPVEAAAAFAVALVVGLVAASFMLLSLRRRAIELTSTQLIVKAGPFTRRVPRSDIDVDGARVSPLGEHPDSHARLKLFGAALPGYRAGWFLMRDGQRAFLMTTTGRALRLPVRDQPALVVTPVQPEALLDALRGVASAQASR
ncbi:hypothetical protein DWG18_08900 [Lysobacter sp. TY2-98]|uniref:PH domain-containing protein n=1 Tax=Lysobacter sp. TY2-98 TaxID=2290922 RepID=UPI000E1FB745|nr:PH domain-containing protein [Lysobacter sp. TY2-98]AXK72379.1 hypothetical protein DWG18_08900 [Lysobacter sp. TY2-98]